MLSLIDQVRRAVATGEFARAEELIQLLPDWLAAQPASERERCAKRLLGEMKEWQRIAMIHRTQLQIQWAELCTSERFQWNGQDSGSGRHKRVWEG